MTTTDLTARATAATAGEEHPAETQAATAPSVDAAPARVSRRAILGMGLGLAGAGTLLAATGAAAAPTPTKAASAHRVAAQDGVVNLRFMRFAGAGWEHDTIFVDRFMEANPNIKVQGEDTVYAEMFNKCLSLGATDNLADVFAGHNRWAPYLAFKGLNLELDSRLGQITNPDDFFPSVMEDARRVGTDGKLMWLPTAVHPAGNAIVVFNMSLLEQAGVTPPESKDWTLADYETLIRAVGKPDEGLFGTDVIVNTALYAVQYARSWGTDPVEGSDDAWLLSRDGTTLQLESPPVKEALEWYRRLVGEKLVPTVAEKAALEGTGADHFAAGLSATKAATVGALAALRQQVGDRFEVQAVLWPLGPHGHRGDALSYNTQSVAARTEHPEEAVKLLDYLTAPEIAFWVGYEGTLHAMARRSAWFNPQLWERFPVMQDAAEWFESGVAPFPQPANLRAVEWEDAWKAETTAYFDAEETWEEMVPHTKESVQRVLDQPRP